MATFTPDKVTTDASSSQAPPAAQDGKRHTGLVSRLLAKVSRWSGEYAEYKVAHQLDQCDWRKISL